MWIWDFDSWLMTAALALPDKTYDTPAKQIGFMRTAVEQLKNSPGVESAPRQHQCRSAALAGRHRFRLKDALRLRGDPGPHGDIRQVSTGYFETMGFAL